MATIAIPSERITSTEGLAKEETAPGPEKIEMMILCQTLAASKELVFLCENAAVHEIMAIFKGRITQWGKYKKLSEPKIKVEESHWHALAEIGRLGLSSAKECDTSTDTASLISSASTDTGLLRPTASMQPTCDDTSDNSSDGIRILTPASTTISEAGDAEPLSLASGRAQAHLTSSSSASTFLQATADGEASSEFAVSIKVSKGVRFELMIEGNG